jgi:hypothetical protein
MPPSDRSMHIYNAFCRYVKDGDKSSIKDFTEEELEFTLLQYSKDKGWEGYNAIEKRIEELKDERRAKRNKNDRLVDRLIGAGIAIGVGIIIAFIKSLFNF